MFPSSQLALQTFSFLSSNKPDDERPTLMWRYVNLAKACADLLITIVSATNNDYPFLKGVSPPLLESHNKFVSPAERFIIHAV